MYPAFNRVPRNLEQLCYFTNGQPAVGIAIRGGLPACWAHVGRIFSWTIAGHDSFTSLGLAHNMLLKLFLMNLRTTYKSVSSSVGKTQPCRHYKGASM